MSDGYSLSLRQARITRWAAILFATVALLQAGTMLVTAALPGFDLTCPNVFEGCRTALDPVDLAPEEARAGIRQTAAARATFAAFVDRPAVRAGIAGLAIGERLPLVALLLGVAVALWRLGARTGDDLARALPWLRHAALAAVVAVLAAPIAGSLRAMLLLRGTPMGPYWYFEIDFVRFFTDLLLALAALAVAWALAAGSRAGRDAAGFV